LSVAEAGGVSIGLFLFPFLAEARCFNTDAISLTIFETWRQVNGIHLLKEIQSYCRAAKFLRLGTVLESVRAQFTPFDVAIPAGDHAFCRRIQQEGDPKA